MSVADDQAVRAMIARLGGELWFRDHTEETLTHRMFDWVWCKAHNIGHYYYPLTKQFNSSSLDLDKMQSPLKAFYSEITRPADAPRLPCCR